MRQKQFSLWMLFIVVGIAAAACAVFSEAWRRAERRREVISYLEARGATVYYEYPDDDGPKRFGSPQGNPLLRPMLGDDYGTSGLYITFAHAGSKPASVHSLEEIISAICELGNVRVLNVTWTTLEPEQVRRLEAELRDVWVVDLSDDRGADDS